MPEYLVDTDVLVDHLRGRRAFQPGGAVVHYSVITRCELYAGRVTDEARVDDLLAPLLELPVDRPTAERAGRIRRTTGTALPDALIAATAIGRELVLLTRNERDFARIPGLNVVDPTGSLEQS